MRFCSSCAAPLRLRVPPGDDRPRHVCDVCGAIHYQNPKVVAGAIPEWEGRILLCRRAIEPRHGLWTLPAGFMENAETTAEAAVRETLEEANARVEIDGLFSVVDIPYINQVYMLFRARLLDVDFSAGAETLDLALFDEADIPWKQMAFLAIEHSLRLYLADRRTHEFGVHTCQIRLGAGGRGREIVSTVGTRTAPPPRDA